MAERLAHSEANSRRIAIVDQCFGSSFPSLVKTGRVLVGEGVLTKMCRKKAKPRQFFLFNDVLVYGNIVIDKRKYNKQHVLPLEDVKLQSLKNDGPWKNGWQIISPKKSFAVFAATPTEKSEWMAHINKCIVDLLEKSNKRPATQHAAVWVPDSEAHTCMHCLKTKFNPVNRKHHCRKCGTVVCGPCSNRRFLLPYQSDKPVRVCITCYDTLVAQSGDGHLEGLASEQEVHVNNNHHIEWGSSEERLIEAPSEEITRTEPEPEPRYGSSDEEDDDEVEPGTSVESQPQFYPTGEDFS